MVLQKRILLIEEEEDIRIAAKIFLAGRGISIDTAPCIKGFDFSEWAYIIVTEERDYKEIPYAVLLTKPYTATTLFDTVTKMLV